MVIILNLSFEREGAGGLNLSFEWGGGGGAISFSPCFGWNVLGFFEVRRGQAPPK